VIVIVQLKSGDTTIVTGVHAFVGSSYVAWNDGEEHCIFFDTTEYLGVVSEQRIQGTRFDATYLEWMVFNGQEVGDDFVIDGEVLSREAVRKLNLKPRSLRYD